MKNKPRILYCNVGYLEKYDGTDTKRPVNGGEYNKNNIGHEVFNFKKHGDFYYGYVQAPGSKDTIRIERLGCSEEDNFVVIDFVVFTAKSVELGKTVVVGYYKNATVYRNVHKLSNDYIKERDEDHLLYNLTSRDCKCIPEEQRKKCHVEKHGRNVMFDDRVEVEEINKRVIRYIEGLELKNKDKKSDKGIKNKENEEKKRKNEIKHIDDFNKQLDNYEREIIVKARMGQGYFKDKMLEKYKKCCLCGLDFDKMLVASHIKPWSKCEDNEKLHCSNGLLLCPNHDKLFDNGYISFDEKGKILIYKKIKKYMLSMKINEDMKIEMDEKMQDFMEYHRRNIYKK